MHRVLLLIHDIDMQQSAGYAMDAGQNKNQRMEFRRIGGSYQQVIRTAADLRLLLSLDEAHWALNSVSVDSVRSDEQFLAFLDDDMNRQIRTDEVRRAVGWFLGMMNDFSGFEAESDVLELSAIDAASPEGARLLDAAKLVLSNIGRETRRQVVARPDPQRQGDHRLRPSERRRHHSARSRPTRPKRPSWSIPR